VTQNRAAQRGGKKAPAFCSGSGAASSGANGLKSPHQPQEKPVRDDRRQHRGAPPIEEPRGDFAVPPPNVRRRLRQFSAAAARQCRGDAPARVHSCGSSRVPAAISAGM